MRRFRVAVAQIAPTLGDLEKNLALHEKTAREAIAQSANLLIFPELSLTGYFLKDQVPSVALRPDAQALQLFRELSQRIAIVLGFVEEAPGHRFYNASAYFEGGEIRHIHRKVYLPTYGIFDEARYLAAGDRIRAFDTALGRMAILICEDLWHPAAPAIAAWDGAEILICPSASPGRGLGQVGPFQNASTWERTIRTCGRPPDLVRALRQPRGLRGRRLLLGRLGSGRPFRGAAGQGALLWRKSCCWPTWSPAPSGGRGWPIRSSGTNGWSSRSQEITRILQARRTDGE